MNWYTPTDGIAINLDNVKRVYVSDEDLSDFRFVFVVKADMMDGSELEIWRSPVLKGHDHPDATDESDTKAEKQMGRAERLVKEITSQ